MSVVSPHFSSVPFALGSIPLDPLPCDSWIARSCLQKAIRRGDTALAVRALANLFLHDPRTVWRHLTIIALEDVGVANRGLLQQIVEAKATSQSRGMPGALWKTHVELTQASASSHHCQATCDLLLRVENDPALSEDRERISEAGPRNWAEALYDGSARIEQRAIAALCFGGFMNAPGFVDASAVFEIFLECGCSKNGGRG